MTGVYSRARRLLVVVAVLALVVQASAPGAAQSSPETPEECDRGYLESTWQVITGTYDYNSGKCHEARAHQNATAADIYASGLALADMQQGAQVSLGNNLEYSRTVVRAAAKAEAVRQFQNGSNQSVTEAAVNETIEEYYATLQANLLETHDAQLAQVEYNYNAENQEGLAVLWFEGSNNKLEPWGESLDLAWSLTGSDGVVSFENYSTSLVNGTTVNYTGMTQQGGNVHEFLDTGHDTAEIGVSPTQDETNVYLIYDGEYYKESWNRIESMTSGVKSNATAYVGDLYATYDNASDLNVTEVLDPLTLAQEFNTNLNSTGSYGWQAAEIGLTGIEGSVNESFTIQYTPFSNHTVENIPGGLNQTSEPVYRYNTGQTVNISGTFFTSWAPASTNGTFQTGTTYNTSNADSPVMFVVQTENGTHTAELDGEFTITELTDVTTGDSLNETTLETKNQQTWNASSTREELRALAEYRDSVSGTYSTGGGSGGFNLGGLSLGGAALGGLVTLGAALLVLGNDNPLSGS
jgi:hypothetical protein